MSISRGALGPVSRAGATAAPLGTVANEVDVGAIGACGSGSRMSAPSPRPSAFLGIDDYLLGELRIALCPFTMDIIENNRLTEARSLGQTDISWDYALKDLGSKEASEVGGHLTRERCSLVIHG